MNTQYKMVAQDPHRIQIGDTVLHKPSGQEWLVAFADYDQNLMSAWGWPESIEPLDNVELIRKADPKSYRDWLPKLLDSEGFRYRRARRLYVTGGGRDG